MSFQNSSEQFLVVTSKVENGDCFSEVAIFPLEYSRLTCVCMWLVVGMLTCTYTPLLFELWNKAKWEENFDVKMQNTGVQNQISNPEIFRKKFCTLFVFWSLAIEPSCTQGSSTIIPLTLVFFCLCTNEHESNFVSRFFLWIYYF